MFTRSSVSTFIVAGITPALCLCLLLKPLYIGQQGNTPRTILQPASVKRSMPSSQSEPTLYVEDADAAVEHHRHFRVVGAAGHRQKDGTYSRKRTPDLMVSMNTAAAHPWFRQAAR